MARRSLPPLVSSRLSSFACLVGIAALASLGRGAETKTIFHDDFNRGDSETVGKNWESKGNVVLKNKALLFQAKEEEFRPRLKHRFPVQKSGTFTVSFLMDWVRDKEGTWGLYLQLGNSAEMPKRLVYPADLAKGISVNLLWGGGDEVDGQAAGSFGHLRDGTFKPLFVINDKKSPKSVVKNPIITIEVDLDAATFTIRCNGKTYPDIPFAHQGPIDTIRFITNGCSETGFTRRSIDDVSIKKEKKTSD